LILVKRLLTYLLFSLIVLLASAQQNDFVLLNGYKLEKKWNRSWATSIAVQNMFNENASEWWIGFVDAGVSFNLTRRLQTELHMRQIKIKTTDNIQQRRQLFYHTLSWYDSFGKWVVSARHRTQQLTYEDHFADQFKGPFFYMRDRFVLKYRLNYFMQPYASAELFFPLNRANRPTVDQYRAAIGCFFVCNDKLRFETYYQVQSPVGRPTSTTRYVLGVNAYLTLP
jgi:hypothetical protein